MRWVFTLVGTLAALAGAALWLAARPPAPHRGETPVAPAVVMAATFTDLEGRKRALGEFQGKVVVLNFWATWCAPCREEMPAFDRLQDRWAGSVRFVGVSAEEPAKVAAFARTLGIRYPLWVGGDEVGELSRRLGNAKGVLPHTVVLDTAGEASSSFVGAYPEADLEATLRRMIVEKRVTPAK